MTDPVNTGTLRSFNAARSDNKMFRMFTIAANELDRLRDVIENAPHAAECRAQFHGGDRYGYGGDARYCTCWKVDAL